MGKKMKHIEVSRKDPYCHDSRTCFAKKGLSKNNDAVCKILTETYRKDGACPFCKPPKKYPWTKEN